MVNLCHDTVLHYVGALVDIHLGVRCDFLIMLKSIFFVFSIPDFIEIINPMSCMSSES